MSLRFGCVSLMAGAMLVSGQSVSRGAQVIYSNDFEGTVGSEWSNTSTDITPVGARHFLGQFGSVSVDQSVTLTLSNIPTHTGITVSFDLYIIDSWDGHGIDVGPDIWDLTAVGVGDLLHTTFSNVENCFGCDRCQDFPGTYPGADYPEKTGAVETNSLGYHFLYGSPCSTTNMDAGDAVYHLTYSFPHADTSLALDFSCSLTGAKLTRDESWGLDNVVVSTTGSVADICTVDQICPCAGPVNGGPWGNHKQYERCVSAVADGFVKAGLITQSEARQLIQNANRSVCGQ
jgi:hypothetical protein